MPITPTELTEIVTAIGALGTAAFGLVEATKVLGGGVNHFGFGGIETVVTALTPSAPANDAANAGNAATPRNALSQPKIIDTLKANWFNGTDLGSQKAIAKSLIKLNLNSENAGSLADATGVDKLKLKTIAENITSGTALPIELSDFFGRFDLILTALLDEVYQRGDQSFKNGTKLCAMIASIALAVLAWAATGTGTLGQALIIGVIATPLAPIAKDLSTALATAVNAMQLVNKGGRA